MCGIAGYYSKLEDARLMPALQAAARSLKKRGPDVQLAEELSAHVGLGHARLSIIDTSSVANQPMHDVTGRYTIAFNGEIFNYRELRETYLKDFTLKSGSDTEILLYMYARMGAQCLPLLNGFFAFAIYDNVTGEIFLARDRYGIKPLHIYNNDGLIVFASELKAIFQFPVKRELNFASLLLYLQLNYLPDEQSMLKHITRLKPGHYAVIDKQGGITESSYYQIPYTPGKVVTANGLNYQAVTKQLRTLIEEAVERRLVSDVPLGAFLSGGIDSSVITACASKQVSNLNTFSIGYKDEPYFDETKYANLVADRFKTNHTVFAVTNDEMFDNIFDILDSIDEPFADSSSIAVYLLCKKTRSRVTVALSGDAGDELFAGYNKHKAEFMARQKSPVNTLAKALHPVLLQFPQSRHSAVGNKVRQLVRFGEGLKLRVDERYWRWCSFITNIEAEVLLNDAHLHAADAAELRMEKLVSCVTPQGDLNDVLLADTKMVLPGDMLTKVDLMSMANSLEVRVPLLDYTVVNFAFSLPVSYKINKTEGKHILKDAFRADLPEELFNRPKHGFEVPLLKWIRTGLRPLIQDELLNDDFIAAQGIFDVDAVRELKARIFSNNPGDTHATIWALVVFQYWYKKYFVE